MNKKMWLILLLSSFIISSCVNKPSNNSYSYYNIEMVIGLDNIETNNDLNKKKKNGVKVIDKLK